VVHFHNLPDIVELKRFHDGFPALHHWILPSQMIAQKFDSRIGAHPSNKQRLVVSALGPDISAISGQLVQSSHGCTVGASLVIGLDARRVPALPISTLFVPRVVDSHLSLIPHHFQHVVNAQLSRVSNKKRQHSDPPDQFAPALSQSLSLPLHTKPCMPNMLKDTHT
jgi:hypothetical protein